MMHGWSDTFVARDLVARGQRGPMAGLYAMTWERPVRTPEHRLRERLAKALVACAVRLAPSLQTGHAPVAASS